MDDQGPREDHEEELIQLWREFSEDVFFASFESP